MVNAIFPLAGDKRYALMMPQDSNRVGCVDLVELDAEGNLVTPILMINNGGGHPEFQLHALTNTDGYETEEDEANHSTVIIHPAG